MFYLLKDLDEWFGPFRLFGYVTARVVLAALTSFILMMIVMPPLIRWLKRKKFGEQGSKGEAAVVDAMRDAKKGTPTMGGLGIILCIAVAALLWCNPTEVRTWILLVGMAGYGVVGYLDDRTKIFKGAKGTPAKVKLAIQIVVAVGLGAWLWWYNGHNAAILDDKAIGSLANGILLFRHEDAATHEVFKVPLGVHELAFPFVPLQFAVNLGVLWIVWSLVVQLGCANGVNFTDGMDGLAAGTMLIATLAFVVIAYLTSRVDAATWLRVLYVPGGQEVAIFCAATAGACLGFLWFNSAPAEVFMGDTGSQALGGILALAALNTRQEFLVLLVGFIFFAEAMSVLLQVASYKLRGGKRIFLCAPLHHHFQYKGWPESKIVMRFWIVAGLAAILALSTLKLR